MRYLVSSKVSLEMSEGVAENGSSGNHRNSVAMKVIDATGSTQSLPLMVSFAFATWQFAIVVEGDSMPSARHCLGQGGTWPSGIVDPL